MTSTGILYPSVQFGTVEDDNYNVVLFHKASQIRYLTLPERKDCRIRFGHYYSEDDWEPDICVIQTAELGNNASCSDRDEIPSHLQDTREPALEVDLPSVCVHSIQAACFKYSTEPVSRDKFIHECAAATPSTSAVVPRNSATGQDDIPY